MSPSRPIVAVIEADAVARRNLCSLLSALDADIHDYESAESYLASHLDDLGCVITDVVLPGMSGLELLRLLRTADTAPPVILLGEEADENAAVAAMREGAVEIDTASTLLTAAVRRYCGCDRYRRLRHPCHLFRVLRQTNLCQSPLRELVVTDTIRMTEDKSRRCGDKIQVLSVAPLLADVILRIHEGRSVGELFNE